MRENNRKPIEKCRKKLPQFTTMNVIDGQAGLMIYSSLIFYSLTIDNILNIIVLLILAAVSIVTLTGKNGILTQASNAKVETRGAEVEEIVNLWKIENEMNGYNNSNESPKSETELLQELLDNKQVFEEEIDRASKTITIGNRVIDYAMEIELTDIYVALYNEGTLVFSNKNDFDTDLIATDWKVENIKGKRYTFEYIEEPPYINMEKLPPWFMKNVQKINFENKIVPDNIDFWFLELSSLTDIENINNLDTRNVTNMANMFNGCSSLNNINLNELDTSNVTNMAGMFRDCSSLSNINLNGLDISNVTNMAEMFNGCSSLSNINLNGLDTSNVTDMTGMFRGCGELTSISLSGLDTSNVTNMNSMFCECSKLTDINLNQINTSNVTNMGSMFYGCSSLTNIDVSSFKTSKVINMMHMFRNCSSLQKLDISNFDVTKTKDNVLYMFEGLTCSVIIGSDWTQEMMDGS